MNHLTIEDIQKVVARHFQMKGGVRELLTLKKNQRYVWPRHLAMYLCRKWTKETLAVIADRFKKKWRNVCYCVDIAKNRIEIYEHDRKTVERIEAKLKKLLIKKLEKKKKKS